MSHNAIIVRVVIALGCCLALYQIIVMLAPTSPYVRPSLPVGSAPVQGRTP